MTPKGHFEINWPLSDILFFKILSRYWSLQDENKKGHDDKKCNVDPKGIPTLVNFVIAIITKKMKSECTSNSFDFG